MSNDAALYREALRMACEHLQGYSMSCPGEEDSELADDETHNCYSCDYFGWPDYFGKETGEAFTEKAVECYMKAFTLRAQKRRDKELKDMEEWRRLTGA